MGRLVVPGCITNMGRSLSPRVVAESRPTTSASKCHCGADADAVQTRRPRYRVDLKTRLWKGRPVYGSWTHTSPMRLHHRCAIVDHYHKVRLQARQYSVSLRVDRATIRNLCHAALPWHSPKDDVNRELSGTAESHGDFGNAAARRE